MITAGVGELTEVVLFVQDMNLEVAFYRDALGLTVKEPEGIKDYRDFYTVSLHTGPCTLILSSGGTRRQGEDAPRIVFRVADVQAARFELLEKGVLMEEITTPDAGRQECEGRDPEGNKFAIESRDDTPFSPRRVTPTPSVAPIYVSVNSRRGRSITLLRYNKLAIAAEVLLVGGVLCALPYIGFASIISPFLIIMALLWLRGNTWSKLGLGRPTSWKSTIAIGVIFGVFFYVLESYFIGPFIANLVHADPDVSVFNPIKGNVPYLIGYLLNTWTSAAFVEEMIFRGYLMNRLADLFGYKHLGWTLAILLQAALFGLAHTYQGLSGILSAGTYGILSGLLYLGSKRNLWICALAHGVVDTISGLPLFIG